MLGSSPLARGLPGTSSRTTPPPRIIPARAGFTGPRTRSAPLSRDHPRSRGVYRSATGRAPKPTGSSPLARGLPGSEKLTDAVDRIIPARAGFTGRCGKRQPPRWDHPRSRGVYSMHHSTVRNLSGSSPLARGLLHARVERVHRRADHPRSRGVYTGMPAAAARASGSSPLARGLLHEDSLEGGEAWIIPARAGFTIAGAQPLGPRPGSSPLARGLHTASTTRASQTWIIPARAGFTQWTAGQPRQRPDHPRSRGVYTYWREWPDDEVGSSPLARGLLRRLAAAIVVSGIIPARAGFTSSTATTSSPPADHPRSRGVYFASHRLHRTVMGSSPLARGLPRPLVPVPRPDADHPRSRGVYEPTGAARVAHTGSSPLARGLRQGLG
mgnify:CR=1 FL=1